MTFHELFRIKSPCEECIVGMMGCRKSMDCKKNLVYLGIVARRVEYWKKNYIRFSVMWFLWGVLFSIISMRLFG